MKFQYLEKRKFEYVTQVGIEKYLEYFKGKDYQLKTVTLSINRDSDNELMWFVPRFFEKIVYFYKNKSYVDISGVIVDKRHGHFICRMPFVPYLAMRDYWKEITGGDTGFYIHHFNQKMMKNVLKGKNFENNPLTYCLNQEKHNKELDYVVSSTWGLLSYYVKKPRSPIIDDPEWSVELQKEFDDMRKVELKE